jgi:signal transduction histidine kinase
MKLRMRTKLLLALLSVSAGLTFLSLFVVQRAIQSQAKKEISTQLQNSIQTFQSFQRERERTLDRSAALLADLPNLRALMTTQHPATIQDASEDVWKLAGSDLFLLANQTGKVVALHTSSPGFTAEMAQPFLQAPLDKQGQWWVGGSHLYEVFARPIYFGPSSEDHVLGFLAVGYEINDETAAEISRVAGGHVAFYFGNQIVKSTLTPEVEKQLANTSSQNISDSNDSFLLGKERFLASSIDLAPEGANSVRLTVLKSYDQATSVLTRLNQLLLILGLVAMTIGSGLAFFISDTFTRPLGKLVHGVRALGKGDFSYPLNVRGGDEVAEVTASFQNMRDNLLRTQQELLEAERLATIGRMANSISHDLRHSLVAVVANAEFLCESKLSTEQREELYEEVRMAVNQMTDLIDSLLEFSRTRESLRPIYATTRATVDRAIQSVRTHPEFQRVQISVTEAGHSEGWFDAKKLQRVLFNLVLNACESVPSENGHVEVALKEKTGGVEIRVADNGRGVPQEVRETLFDPFVSYGKENGTGLGLTVVQKIISDHGGDVVVEKTSSQGTVFKLWLPLPLSPDARGEGVREDKFPPTIVPKQSMQK